MAVAHTEKYLRLGTSLKLLPISAPYRLVCDGLNAAHTYEVRNLSIIDRVQSRTLKAIRLNLIERRISRINYCDVGPFRYVLF